MSHPLVESPPTPAEAGQAVVPVTPRPMPPGLRPAQAPTAKPGIDWPAVLHGLRRRWLLILCLGVIVGAGTGALVWFFFPPLLPEAEVLLIVRNHIDPLLPNAPRERLQSGKTRLALAKSRPVLVKALGALPKEEAERLRMAPLEPDPITWLENEIQVSFLTPELLAIRLQGENPKQLEALTNAVADTYLIDVINKEHVRRAQDLEHLRDIEKTFTDRLKRARDAVRKLKERLGAGNDEALTLQFQLVQMELSKATSDLAKINGEVKRLAAEINYHTNKGNRVPVATEAEVNAAEVQDVESQSLKAEEGQIKLILEGIKAKSVRWPNEPKAKPWQDRLEQIDNRKKERRKELHALLLDSKKGGPADREALEEQFRHMQELAKALEEDTVKLQRKAMDQVAKGLDVGDFEREIEELEKLVKSVSSRAEALQVQLDRAPPPAELYQRAVVRQPDNEGRKVKMAGLGAMGGFGAVVFLIGFWEFRNRRVSSPSQVVLGVGLDLVGTVPNYARRLTDKYTPSGWQRQLMESVDTARTMVLYKARKENLKVVMIASAVGGEGKTSLACHLATSLARAGRATLLLDGDLRKPTAHAVFQMDLEPGICDLLRGSITIEAAIRPTNIPNLSFLGAGQCDEHALASLAADGIAPVMQYLREHFDFIVVDSSPVLPVADAMIISEQVDGVLFAVLQNVSRLPKVQAACQRLASVGVNILGAVVNGTDDRGHGYGGYGYDYYYYGYGRLKKNTQNGSAPTEGTDPAGPGSEGVTPPPPPEPGPG